MVDQKNPDNISTESSEDSDKTLDNTAGLATAGPEDDLEQETTGGSPEFDDAIEDQEERRKKAEKQEKDNAKARAENAAAPSTDNSPAGLTTVDSKVDEAAKDEANTEVDAGSWAGLAPANAQVEDNDSPDGAESAEADKKSADNPDTEDKTAAKKTSKREEEEELYKQAKKSYPHSFLYYLAKKYETDQNSFDNISNVQSAPVKPVLEQLETISAPEDPTPKYNKLLGEKPLVTAYPVGTNAVIEVYRNKVRSKNTTLETAIVNAALAKANPGIYGGRVKLLPEGSAEAKAMLVAAAEFMGLEVVGKKPDEKLIAKYRGQCVQTWQGMQTAKPANPAAEKSADENTEQKQSAKETQKEESADTKPANENEAEAATPVPATPTDQENEAEEEAAAPENTEDSKPNPTPSKTEEKASADKEVAESLSEAKPADEQEPDDEKVSAAEEEYNEEEEFAEKPEADGEHSTENNLETERDLDPDSNPAAQNETESEPDENNEEVAKTEEQPPRRTWLDKLASVPVIGWLFKGALEKEAKSTLRKLNEYRGQSISKEEMDEKWQNASREEKEKILGDLPYYRKDVASLEKAANTSWQDLQDEKNIEQREAVEALARAQDVENLATYWEAMTPVQRMSLLEKPENAKQYAAQLEEQKEDLKWAESVAFDDDAVNKELIGRFLELSGSDSLDNLEKAWNGELEEGKNLSASDKLYYLDQEQLARTVTMMEQAANLGWDTLQDDAWKAQKEAVEALAKASGENSAAAYWDQMKPGERLGVLQNPQAAQQRAALISMLKAQQEQQAQQAPDDEVKAEAEDTPAIEGKNKHAAPKGTEATASASDEQSSPVNTDAETIEQPNENKIEDQNVPTANASTARVNVLETPTPNPVLEILSKGGVSDEAYRIAMERVIQEQQINRDFVKKTVDDYLEANPEDKTGELYKKDRVAVIRKALIEHGIAKVTDRQIMSVIASEQGEISVAASTESKPNEEASKILKQAGISEAFYQAAKKELLEIAETHPERMVPPYQVKGMLLDTGNYVSTNNKHRKNKNPAVIRAADQFMRAMEAEGLVKPKAGMEKKRYPNFVLANNPSVSRPN